MKIIMWCDYLIVFYIRYFYHVYKLFLYEVSKGAKFRNRYNQVPHLIQDTNWKVTNSQLDTTTESQEVTPCLIISLLA